MTRRNKTKWRRFFESPLFFVLGILVLLFVSINLIRAQFKDRTIRLEILRLENEVIKLEEEQTQYERLLTLFEDPIFLEEEARRALGVVKPGEQVVVIEQQGQPRQQEQQEQISNPMKWWIYFFGELW